LSFVVPKIALKIFPSKTPKIPSSEHTNNNNNNKHNNNNNNNNNNNLLLISIDI